MNTDRITQELSNGVFETNFETKRTMYRGKVRDCYIGETDRVMVVSDRISAFDTVFDEGIPFKGQVLNQVAAWSLKQVEDICDHHVLYVPDPNVTVGKECEPVQLEMVVRGYLVGHSWRVYKSGKRELCGAMMPDGLKENSKFPEPILTPATKEAEGHDLDISPAEAVAQGVVSQELMDQMTEVSFALYKRGSEIAAKQGLILVDTKYEFGIFEGKITLMDEIHTPDCSRYFYADGYESKLANDEPQKHLSKEFAREWLMANNFQGLAGQVKPKLTDEIRMKVSARYIELYEQLTGEAFVFPTEGDTVERIFTNIKSYL